MSSNIFREKSLERISSPEDLKDYVKVTNPGVWMIIVAIIILLVGALIWAVTYVLTSDVECAVIVENGNATCYILEELGENVRPGMTVSVQNTDYELGQRQAEPVDFDASGNATVMHLLGQDEAQRVWTYAFDAKIPISDGMYKGYVTIDRMLPIEFITD